MTILGIEAAARACSAAIIEDGKILAEVRSNAGMTHSETLMPMVDQVLTLSGKTTEQLNAIALTKGPGSFTGLRIGAATAKGLALGLQIPLIPVGTLEALTYAGDMDELSGMIRVGMMDARRSQVYAAVYRGKETVTAPDAMAPADLLKKLQEMDGPVVFFGDAVPVYGKFFRENLGERYREAPAVIRELSAASVCALAEDLWKQNADAAIPGGALKLDYLRKPQAVREREERAAAAGQTAAPEVDELVFYHGTTAEN